MDFRKSWYQELSSRIFWSKYWNCSSHCSQRHVNNDVFAIVSRSGRPDLAGQDYLSQVKAPILFIVGGNDTKKVIELNKDALKQIGSEKKKLVTVPNATHLFEEPGTLEEVARLASGCYYLMKNKHNNDYSPSSINNK